MFKRVLLVDDDAVLRRQVAQILEKDGYHVRQAGSAEEAWVELRRAAPDLILLDVRMPGESGFDLCRRLRGDSGLAGVPVIFLTSKEDQSDKVLGLELGGDDYVVKPFGFPELLARIKAVLRRRAGGPEAPVVKGGAVEVDELSRTARIGRRQIVLPAKEFDLLLQLLKRKGKVLSRAYLLGSVWGEGGEVATRTVDTHVYRLRKSLGTHGSCVKSVDGLGYKWEDL